VFSEYDTLNGEIEHTMQSLETGDCWLLAGVNSLNTTPWGRKIIKNALRPDGEGGAIVTLRGADNTQKEYRVTLAELDKALLSDKYSVGDDDMLAIELAVEKYAKKQIEAGKLDKSSDKAIVGGIDRNMLYLLSGKPSHDFHAKDKNIDSALDKIMANSTKYSSYCAFQNDTEHLSNYHAYTIKEIKKDLSGNKFVVLINPQDSESPEIVPYEEFRNNLRLLVVLDNPANPDNTLKSEIDLIDEQIESLKKENQDI